MHNKTLKTEKKLVEEKQENVCFTGGCKQKKMNSDLFVRRSDLMCFRCTNKSEVRC